MIYIILTNDTHKIICRSIIRSALNPSAPNLRLDISDGEYKDRTHTLLKEKDTYVEIIKSANNLRQEKTMMVISPEDMVGRSFLDS